MERPANTGRKYFQGIFMINDRYIHIYMYQNSMSNISIKNMDKQFKQYFTKEMAKKYMKRCSTTSVIKKTQKNEILQHTHLND